MCTNFQTKRRTLNFWAQICPEMGFGVKISKIESGFEVSILEILRVPILRHKGQLWIFGLKFAQKWVLGSEFQKSKSGFKIKSSNMPCVPVFSQNGQLLIFWPKFGEIAQLHALFWFKYCWGCWRELGGGWNELGGSGWSWVELDGGVWSWVEVGAPFSNTHLNLVSPFNWSHFHRCCFLFPCFFCLSQFCFIFSCRYA